MPAAPQVTTLIEQFHGGDPDAAAQLWHRYFPQIVRLARARLKGARRAVADEEDVALSAFKSLWMGVQEGRFPKLTNRDSLWSLLVAITAHKSVDLIRRENRQKRGGTGGPCSTTGDDCGAKSTPLSGVIEPQANPEFAALIGDQFEALVKKLDCAEDPDLLPVAIAKMLGDSTPEIAARLGCVRRTVERKLALIRRIWEDEIESV